MSDQDFVTNKLPLNLQPGDAVVFPSFVNHSVTPITSGTRQSLTGWIKGPALT
jgi:PKHD-type hydroxylase